MNAPKTEYGIANRISNSYPQTQNAVLPDSVFSCIGHIFGFSKGDRMTSAPPIRSCLLQQLTLLAAFVMCVGHSIVDTHIHLNEHEEETCTLCVISEPGHVPQDGRIDVRPSEWQCSDSLPVVSATLCPRPYEFGHPRAPPFSIA